MTPLLAQFIATELQPLFVVVCGLAVLFGCLTYLGLSLVYLNRQRLDRERTRTREGLGGATNIWVALKNYVLTLSERFQDEQHRIAKQQLETRKFDFTLAAVIALASVSLSLNYYYGGSARYENLESIVSFLTFGAKTKIEIFESDHWGRLARLAYWSCFLGVTYFLLPYTFGRVVLKRQPSQLGLKLEGLLSHSWIYVGLFAIVLPFVIFVSRTSSFQSTYPFFSGAGESLKIFLLWELVYGIQFLALEFFYRGFLIHTFKPRIGLYAILIGIMPYCMIHFGKPLPETLGAILAGLALGLLSYFSESIWLGVLIHVSVALTMDFLALGAKGELFFF